MKNFGDFKMHGATIKITKLIFISIEEIYKRDQKITDTE
jgi:hypothetical protein